MINKTKINQKLYRKKDFFVLGIFSKPIVVHDNDIILLQTGLLNYFLYNYPQIKGLWGQ